MPGFSCPALLWCHPGLPAFRLRGFRPLRPAFPKPFGYAFWSLFGGPQPRQAAPAGLASFPFARRYLGNRCFFLFLGLLRCFSSPRSPRTRYVFARRCLHIAASGLPHSDVCGSSGYLLLPAAFRSLSRPSSAPSAKASASCPSLLDLPSFH